MRKEDIKRDKLPSIIMTGVFIGYLAVFSLGTLLIKDREFSEMENRPLAQKPELTTEAVMNGEFGNGTEKYMSDQIFLKDKMMSLKTSFDLMSGRTYQNGVYFGKGGYLMQRFTFSDQLETNMKLITDFADSCTVPVSMILAPNSICVNADRLPKDAVTDNQVDIHRVSQFEKFAGHFHNYVMPYSRLVELQEQGIQTYFRTDHHWTVSGARATLDMWLDKEGIGGTDAPYEYLDGYKFYGTLYSKVPAFGAKSDNFGYFFNPEGQYTIEYVMEGRTTDRFVDEADLEKKDKYGALLGGNFALLHITSNAAGGRKLVVVKDSYANAMLPMLADKFSEMWVVDLRYYHTGTVSELIEQNGADEVLFIHNMDFLNEDRNFVWLG
ncbi:DHHW protein [Ruminococcus sp. YE71]|uniref:DHHW family protein n=1 Tax=unclassified Ruminococcus TaxID=2608920 RepID=UPI00088A444B|nr:MULTISPECIES: DHHW family protein [unclassified Ruminococcus]SDA16150.1 DHHW protein [Ruminococcus sp. YE78]SFW24055.1 DHHW protein [Ruminococcus sp. YE71]